MSARVVDLSDERGYFPTVRMFRAFKTKSLAKSDSGGAKK